MSHTCIIRDYVKHASQSWPGMHTINDGFNNGFNNDGTGNTSSVNVVWLPSVLLEKLAWTCWPVAVVSV
jgi:hypothetical protein